MTKKSIKVGEVCIISRDRFALPKERFLFFIFVSSHLLRHLLFRHRDTPLCLSFCSSCRLSRIYLRINREANVLEWLPFCLSP